MKRNYWHEYYDNQLTENEKEAVDYAYESVTNIFESKGIKVSNDDRAEELVSAITAYLIQSKS